MTVEELLEIARRYTKAAINEKEQRYYNDKSVAANAAIAAAAATTAQAMILARACATGPIVVDTGNL